MPLLHRRALVRATSILLASVTAGGLLTSTAAGAGSGDRSLDRTLQDSRIDESSGLARSTYARRILFTHNDSGDRARVFAVDGRGRTAAVLTLSGVTSRDNEDIAAGPNHTLWLGDIGDNRGIRDTIKVFRFTEPRRLTNGNVPAKTYELAYPDGRHNAEGLMVRPRSGRLYVVTKASSGAGIYVAPSKLSTTKVNRLTRVASAPSLVKAASFSRDGSRFVLAGGSYVYVYRSIGGKPTRVRKPPLRQGESVAVSRGGGKMFVGTEGRPSPVYQLPMP